MVEAAGGAWRDALALSEADLAALVRSDGVDILVDLTGHTANNRLGTFAMRPAPIQVNRRSLSSTYWEWWSLRSYLRPPPWGNEDVPCFLLELEA